MPGRSIFLSPHLDDAVLSAGALIARAAAQGRQPEVWTLFTEGPQLSAIAPRLRVFGDYAVRRAEDQRALMRLGARACWLGLTERIFSDPRVTSARAAFRTPPDVGQFQNLDRLQELIAELTTDPNTVIYAPLGAGNHYDHVEVALASVKTMISRGSHDQFRFYEDFYAADGAARRRHYVTRRWRWSALQAPGWASWKLGSLLRLTAWSARGPGVDAYAPEVAGLQWSSTAEPVTDFEAVKLAAIGEYHSQLAALGGSRAFERLVRRAHAASGGERIWRAQPRPPHEAGR